MGPRTTLLLALAWAAPAAAQEAERHADLDWQLVNAEGARLDLRSMAGEVLFVNVWASWCAPCVEELPSIEALADSLAPEGVRFLAISPERPERAARFLATRPVRLPVWFEDSEIPPAWELAMVPTTWIVDREGRIVVAHRGATDWNRAETRALLRHLLGPPPAGAAD